MIKPRLLASGEYRFDVEVRVNGEKMYGIATSMEGAERIQDDFIAARRKNPKPIKTPMDTFLRMACVPGLVVAAECRECA